MPSEMEKIKKKLEEFQETIKEHNAAAERAQKKRLDDFEARLKALEEKAKKRL
jgi:phage-related tail protein